MAGSSLCALYIDKIRSSLGVIVEREKSRRNHKIGLINQERVLKEKSDNGNSQIVMENG